MIDNDKYLEILNSGLVMDHYLVLCSIKNGEKLVDSKRIQGFINLLTKKGYIEDDNLTEKAFDLIQDCEILSSSSAKNTAKQVDHEKWVLDFHSKLQDRLLELTGKKQVTDRIGKGKAYAFLPNPTDLGKVLLRTMTIYKLKDRDKIEKAVFRYLEKCNDANSWFPILQYYIMKNGTSQLVTDLDDLDENEDNNSNYTSSVKLL